MAPATRNIDLIIKEGGGNTLTLIKDPRVYIYNYRTLY